MEGNFTYFQMGQTPSSSEQFLQAKGSLRDFASKQMDDCTFHSLKKEGDIFLDHMLSKNVNEAAISGFKLCSKSIAMPCVLPVRGAHRTWKNVAAYFKRSNLNTPTDDINTPLLKASKSNQQILMPLPKTKQEISLNRRISNSRDLIRQGIFETTELQEKRRVLSMALKQAYANNEISEEFYKGAQQELKKFDNDFIFGKEELLKNLDLAYEMAVEMNKRSLEFYEFINDNNVNAPRTSITTIHGTLTKIETIYQDTLLSENRKQSSIFSLRGYERMEAEQSYLIEDLKQAAYENIVQEQRTEIDLAVLTIKKYLTHDLKEEENHPEKDEVLTAYTDLEKALKSPRNT